MFIPTTFGGIPRYRRDDAEALANHANNRKVWLNMRDAFPHPYSREHAEALLDMVAAQNPLRFSPSQQMGKSSAESESRAMKTSIASRPSSDTGWPSLTGAGES